VTGAISPGEVERMLEDAGFQGIEIAPKERSDEIIQGWNVGNEAEKAVFSAYITAVKGCQTKGG